MISSNCNFVKSKKFIKFSIFNIFLIILSAKNWYKKVYTKNWDKKVYTKNWDKKVYTKKWGKIMLINLTQKSSFYIIDQEVVFTIHLMHKKNKIRK